MIHVGHALAQLGLEIGSDGRALHILVEMPDRLLGCVWTQDALSVAWTGQDPIRLPGDPDRLAEAIIDVLEADRVGTPTVASTGLSTRLEILSDRGLLSLAGTTRSACIRPALHVLWRLAMAQLPDRRSFEALHRHLDLPDPPWEEQRGRRLRLFGVLDRVPPIHSGGWIVDATALEGIQPSVRMALESLPPLGDVWFGYSAPRPLIESDPMRSQRLERVREACWKRLEPHIPPRNHQRARQQIQEGAPWVDLERWIEGWTACAPPAEAFFLTPAPRITLPPPPWVAFNAAGVWACEGHRVFTPGAGSSG